MAFRSADESANEQYKRATIDDSGTSGLNMGLDRYCDGLPSSVLYIFVFSCLYTYYTGPYNTDNEDGDLVRVNTAMPWVLYNECAGIHNSMSPDLPGEMYMHLSSLPCHTPCPSHFP